jgi:hypothetical protein
MHQFKTKLICIHIRQTWFTNYVDCQQNWILCRGCMLEKLTYCLFCLVMKPGFITVDKWPLKITLTVTLIHGVPLREVKVWCVMCYKCNYDYWAHHLSSDHKFTPKPNIFWHHLIHLSDYTRLYVFVRQENATAHNIKHFQHDHSGTHFHSDHVSI